MSNKNIQKVSVNGYQFDVEVDMEDDLHMNIILDNNIELLGESESETWSTLSALNDLIHEVNSDKEAGLEFKKLYDSGWRFYIQEDDPNSKYWLMASKDDLQKEAFVNNKLTTPIKHLSQYFTEYEPENPVKKPKVKSVLVDIVINMNDGSRYVKEGAKVVKDQLPDFSEQIAAFGITIKQGEEIITINPSGIASVSLRNTKDV